MVDVNNHYPVARVNPVRGAGDESACRYSRSEAGGAIQRAEIRLPVLRLNPIVHYRQDMGAALAEAAEILMELRQDQARGVGRHNGGATVSRTGLVIRQVSRVAHPAPLF